MIKMLYRSGGRNILFTDATNSLVKFAYERGIEIADVCSEVAGQYGSGLVQLLILASTLFGEFGYLGNFGLKLVAEVFHQLDVFAAEAFLPELPTATQ